MLPLEFLLTPVFNAALILGAFLSLLLMQLTNRYEELNGVSALLQWLHRLGLALMALCFLWAFLHGRNMNWEPWPPMAALIVVIDFKLVIRAFMLWRVLRRIERGEKFPHFALVRQQEPRRAATPGG